jgi:hypothetical protein
MKRLPLGDSALMARIAQPKTSCNNTPHVAMAKNLESERRLRDIYPPLVTPRRFSSPAAANDWLRPHSFPMQAGGKWENSSTNIDRLKFFQMRNSKVTI